MTKLNVPMWFSLRIVLPLLVLFALSSAILGVSLHTLRGAKQQVVRDAKPDLMWRTVRASETLQRLHSHDDHEGMQQLIASFGADPHVVGAWLLDSNDVVIGATERRAIGLSRQAAFAGYESIRYQERAAYVRLRRIVDISVFENQLTALSSVPLGGGMLGRTTPVIAVFVIVETLERPLATELYLVQQQAVALSLIMCLSALLMAVLLHVVISRRVIRFAAAAQQLADGDLTVRMSPTGRDELAYMAKSFNTMAERIGASQRALIESEERFRIVARATNDAVWDWNLVANNVWWNEGLHSLFGYTKEQIGLDVQWWLEHIHPEDHDAVRNNIRAAIESREEHWRAEYRFCRADGSYADVYDRGFVIRDSEAKPTRMIGAMQDISLRKKAERDLRTLNEELEERIKDRTRQLELANKELESFSYSVSHDLRGPLRALSGFSQALLEDYAGKFDANATEYLHRIQSASHRMGQLIDDLLKLSRVSRTELLPETVNLSALVTKICTSLQQREPQRDVVITIAEDGIVQGDPKLLEIALENLLNNAWKFTNKTASARIEFGKTEQQGETVYFIRDNGAGFDMRYVNKLFKPFERLHSASEFDGTGIGLSIVSRIILRHGGRIWAEGEEGKGATFYFTLPTNGKISDIIPASNQ